VVPMKNVVSQILVRANIKTFQVPLSLTSDRSAHGKSCGITREIDSLDRGGRLAVVSKA
jgi:hypothetical protein